MKRNTRDIRGFRNSKKTGKNIFLIAIVSDQRKILILLGNKLREKEN